jgi:hypothetical protein
MEPEQEHRDKILQELAEKGCVDPNAKPIPDIRNEFPDSPLFNMWLYGYDASTVANVYLDKLNR